VLDLETPLSRGGKNAIENVQVLHRDVNSAKGTMTTEEFVAMCREVVAMVDSQCQEISGLSNASTTANGLSILSVN